MWNMMYGIGECYGFAGSLSCSVLLRCCMRRYAYMHICANQSLQQKFWYLMVYGEQTERSGLGSVDFSEPIYGVNWYWVICNFGASVIDELQSNSWLVTNFLNDSILTIGRSAGNGRMELDIRMPKKFLCSRQRFMGFSSNCIESWVGSRFWCVMGMAPAENIPEITKE